MSAQIKPKFTHCALFVRDLDRMLDFYTRVLGLVVTDRGKAISAPVDMVFMSNDPDEHHQFVLVTGRPEKVDFHLNQQFSFLVDSLAELRAMHTRMEEEKMANLRCATHGNAWSIYFDDPEENLIEIYMHTPWYIPQPHLVSFDLDKPDAEIIAETEKHCREYSGFLSADERKSEMARLIDA